MKRIIVSAIVAVAVAGTMSVGPASAGAPPLNNACDRFAGLYVNDVTDIPYFGEPGNRLSCRVE
jgi:hypothetical protein